MSRLYAWIESDTGFKPKTITGNTKLQFLIHYGSRQDSKPLARISIRYEPTDFEPKITIFTPEDKTNRIRLEVI